MLFWQLGSESGQELDGILDEMEILLKSENGLHADNEKVFQAVEMRID